MSKYRLLRKANRKIVVLPETTTTLRSAGEITPTQEVVAILRPVMAGEIAGRTGNLSHLLPQIDIAEYLDADQDVRDKMDRDRQEAALKMSTTDPNYMREAQALRERQRRAMIAFGVVAIDVRVIGEPVSEARLQAPHDPSDEATPDDLGADFELVYSTLQSLADLPTSRQEARDLRKFLRREPAEPDVSDGAGSGDGPVDDVPRVDAGKADV